MKPIGEIWSNVEPPAGAHLKQISVGPNVVWALDDSGRLSVRREIQPRVFPEGTHWQTLPAMPNDPIHIGIHCSKHFTFLSHFSSTLIDYEKKEEIHVFFNNFSDRFSMVSRRFLPSVSAMTLLNNICFGSDQSVITAKQGFRHISVGRETGQVWAISGAGIVCRRIGITDDNPAGTGWVTGIGVS